MVEVFVLFCFATQQRRVEFLATIDHAVLEIFRNQSFSRDSQCVEEEQRPGRPPSRPRPHTAPTPALTLEDRWAAGASRRTQARPGPCGRLRTPGGPVPTTERRPPVPPVSSGVLERPRGADAWPSPYRSRISCEPVIRSRSTRRWSILHFGDWAPESPRPGVTLWRSRSLRGAGFPPAGLPRSRACRMPACAGPGPPSSRPGRCLPDAGSRLPISETRCTWGWRPVKTQPLGARLWAALGGTERNPAGKWTRLQAPRSCAAVAWRRAGCLTFLIF